MVGVITFLGLATVVWLVFRTRPQLASDALQQWLDRGARVIDVRSPGEFASGHVQGALNIPVDELGLRLDDVGDRDTPVIVYCASGTRSRRAAGILRHAGYEVLDAGTAHAFPPGTPIV